MFPLRVIVRWEIFNGAGHLQHVSRIILMILCEGDLCFNQVKVGINPLKLDAAAGADGFFQFSTDQWAKRFCDIFALFVGFINIFQA